MAVSSGVQAFIRHAARVAVVAAALWIPEGSARAQAEDSPDGERLHVNLDEAKLIKLPERVATIVVGNPLIADASLQAGGLAVLTGKGYGSTNFIALDRRGNALLEKTVQVHGAKNTVVVYKGVNRETYSCAPNCQPVIAPGDFQQFFTQTLVQTTTRSSQATAMSAPR
jgi:hypothetical protein